MLADNANAGSEKSDKAAEFARVACSAPENISMSVDIDSIINRLLEARGCFPGKQIKLEEREMLYVCTNARNIFLSQLSLLELRAPIKVTVSKSFSFKNEMIVSSCANGFRIGRYVATYAATTRRSSKSSVTLLFGKWDHPRVFCSFLQQKKTRLRSSHYILGTAG
jgi:hypothetical protein